MAIKNFDTLVVFHILDLVSNIMCLIDDMQNGESARGDTCQLTDAISVMSAVGCVIMRRSEVALEGKKQSNPSNRVDFIAEESRVSRLRYIIVNTSAYLETDLRYQFHKRLLIRVVWGQFQSRQWRSIWRGFSEHSSILLFKYEKSGPHSRILYNVWLAEFPAAMNWNLRLQISTATPNKRLKCWLWEETYG